jgi:hypothetical protein
MGGRKTRDNQGFLGFRRGKLGDSSRPNRPPPVTLGHHRNMDVNPSHLPGTSVPDSSFTESLP